MNAKQSVRIWKRLYFLLALFGLTALFFVADAPFDQINELGGLIAVGIGAATIANSTGMGGGVVFLPAFEYLDIQGVITVTAAQIIGMSFVIQAFGMTTGATRWLAKIYAPSHKAPDTGVSETDFWTIVGLALMTALPVMVLTQYLVPINEQLVLFIFKAFSIVLGIKLLIAMRMTRGTGLRSTAITRTDKIVVMLCGALGGVATALFSIGVGEFIALYLFIRNFPLVTCSATAVILSAITVLVGLPYHLIYTDLPWNALVFVVPGAMIGAYIARAFAYFLGNFRLKLMAALWIILSSSYMLIHSL